jgi:hypothetical protein
MSRRAVPATWAVVPVDKSKISVRLERVGVPKRRAARVGRSWFTIVRTDGSVSYGPA